MNRRSLILTIPAFWPLTKSALAQSPKPYHLSLLSGGIHGDDYHAAVLLSLLDGWKTYWRMPGEAGIAPEFDWQKSENLADVTVFYPKPSRYHGGDGETIGYKGDVLFPLLVRPRVKENPVTLELSLSFAVCEKICVPAHADAQAIVPGTTLDEATWAHWQASVPEIIPPGKKGVILDGQLATRDNQLFLVVKFDQPVDDVFVESETSAYVKAPEFSPDKREAWLPIDNISNAAKLSGQQLRLTVLMNDRALQETLPLP